MTFWVHAFCNEEIPRIDGAALKAGIQDRLALLTYQFCPEDEEDPAEVAATLSIEVPAETNAGTACLIRYGRSGSVIPVLRHGRAMIAELSDRLRDEQLPKDRRVGKVVEKLAFVREDLSFALKNHHVRGMGFPVSIAAAAQLVADRGGFIQSGRYAWMVPSGREVDILLEVKG